MKDHLRVKPVFGPERLVERVLAGIHDERVIIRIPGYAFSPEICAYVAEVEDRWSWPSVLSDPTKEGLIRIGRHTYGVQCEFRCGFSQPHAAVETMSGDVHHVVAGPPEIELEVLVRRPHGNLVKLRFWGTTWSHRCLQESQAGNERKAKKTSIGIWKSLNRHEQQFLTWVAGLVQNNPGQLVGMTTPPGTNLRLRASQIFLALTAFEDDEYRHPRAVKDFCKHQFGIAARGRQPKLADLPFSDDDAPFGDEPEDDCY